MASDAVIVRDWDRRPPRGGTAVVIDVLRFSTTVCALLAARRRRVVVARTPAALRRLPGLSGCDVYSELDFRSRGRRFDNSPHMAFSVRSPRPAAVTTGTGARALFAARGADEVLIGGFANFSALLRRLRRAKGPIRLLPAAARWSGHRDAVEDLACAEALSRALGGSRGEAAKGVRRVVRAGRVEEHRRFRPFSADIDLDYCLRVDRLPLVPRARFTGPSTARLSKVNA
ncbi:MAG: 2-phosphosulfolactate phosphatase [Elusimicrobiota bacterium]|jgi:phosphosulfolactate phosphohydrolase-like enzyme